MIRIQANEFTPGSIHPRFTKDVGSFDLPDWSMEAIENYVSLSAWESGMTFLIIGAPGAGKTSTGLYLMRAIHKTAPELQMAYWVESDFYADLRNLWRFESLVTGSPNDSPLWQEYLAWERDLWDLKETPLLFLDDLGRGRTTNQRYEIETVLRKRKDQGFATIAAVSHADWGAVTPSLQALFADGLTIMLKDGALAER